MPPAARLRLARTLGFVSSRVLRIRRDLVERQVRESFPDQDEAWLRQVALGSYDHLAQEAVSLLRMGRLSAEHVRQATRVEGWDAFEQAVRSGTGVVVVTGHLGNWEIGGAAMAARGLPIDVVAQRQSNPLFDRALNDVRERLGMRVIDRGEAPRRVLRSLRQGRVVAFVADQDAKRAGVFVPFLGRLASTHRGPALFALRSGAPMFLGTATGEPDGGYLVRFEPIDADRSGEADAAIVRLTAAFTEALERQVARTPEQYFWLHRRWKTRPRPPEPSDSTGTEARGSRGTDPSAPRAAGPDGPTGTDPGGHRVP